MYFIVFMAVNLFAASVNHIDDTDEVYGYWEVLHFLLYHKGMQTWEYSPEFAVRTYAFIYALYPFGYIYQAIGMPKSEVFHGIRLVMAAFTAYSEMTFIKAVEKSYGAAMTRFLTLLMIFSPGIFYSSTSFLPSAVVMNTVMISFAHWMSSKYESAILWACVGTLVSGWPFVGVIFVPMGLHMLYATYTSEGPQGSMTLTFRGASILVAILTLVLSIDYQMYGKLTSPLFNIVLYNAGGDGDNLYGVEPASYYVNNLFLTLGVAWPLSAAAPLLYFREYLEAFKEKKEEKEEEEDKDHDDDSIKGNEKLMRMVIGCSTMLWLLVLFKRPHKEERFMYPIYPLICFLAASSMVLGADLIGNVAGSLSSPPEAPSDISQEFALFEEKLEKRQRQKAQLVLKKREERKEKADALKAAKEKAEKGGGVKDSGDNKTGVRRSKRSNDNNNDDKSTDSPAESAPVQEAAEEPFWNRPWGYKLKYAFLYTVMLVSVSTGLSRTASNYFNFGGYMKLWRESITSIPKLSLKYRHHLTNSEQIRKTELKVCLGNEWYIFPSHFYLPQNVTMGYVRDDFRGILPQPFAHNVGVIGATSGECALANNDQNREEQDRYVQLSECDYVVASVNPHSERDRSSMLRKMTILFDKKSRHKYVDTELDLAYYEPTLQFSVLDSERSPRSLLRSFYVPYFSDLNNKQKEYTLFARIRRQDII